MLAGRLYMTLQEKVIILPLQRHAESPKLPQIKTKRLIQRRILAAATQTQLLQPTAENDRTEENAFYL